MKREILRMEHILCRDGEAQQLNYLSMQIFEGEIYNSIYPISMMNPKYFSYHSRRII